MALQLVIGNKNYSSWSLRAWLMLSHYGLAFTEIPLALDTDDFESQIDQYGPTRQVPVLIDGDLTVWDSLAICEYVSERYLDGKGWPEPMAKRAQARAFAAEMHSGFTALRQAMPMNCRAKNRSVEITPELKADIDRIDAIWTQCRAENKAEGDWLFGKFSVVDCMYAPIVMRFATYGVQTNAQQYMQTLIESPQMQHWLTEATHEQEMIQYEEVGL